ncbi:MAG: hypothetical protein JNM67_12170 [Bacteroidetes bacterium]|nr:hypothetical protein [Bacteroidota bacterium]
MVKSSVEKTIVHTTNDYLAALNSTLYFVFSKSETVCLGALIAQRGCMQAIDSDLTNKKTGAWHELIVNTILQCNKNSIYSKYFFVEYYRKLDEVRSKKADEVVYKVPDHVSELNLPVSYRRPRGDAAYSFKTLIEICCAYVIRVHPIFLRKDKAHVSNYIEVLFFLNSYVRKKTFWKPNLSKILLKEFDEIETKLSDGITGLYSSRKESIFIMNSIYMNLSYSNEELTKGQVEISDEAYGFLAMVLSQNSSTLHAEYQRWKINFRPHIDTCIEAIDKYINKNYNIDEIDYSASEMEYENPLCEICHNRFHRESMKSMENDSTTYTPDENRESFLVCQNCLHNVLGENPHRCTICNVYYNPIGVQLEGVCRECEKIIE